MTMTSEEGSAIALSLGAVAAAFKEYERQRATRSSPSPVFLLDTLTREATRVQVNGQEGLADGLRALRASIEEAHNG